MELTTTKIQREVAIPDGQCAAFSAFTQLQALRAWAFLSGEGGYAGIGDSHTTFKGEMYNGDTVWVRVYSTNDVNYAWSVDEPFMHYGQVI